MVDGKEGPGALPVRGRGSQQCRGSRHRGTKSLCPVGASVAYQLAARNCRGTHPMLYATLEQARCTIEVHADSKLSTTNSRPLPQPITDETPCFTFCSWR